MLKPETLDFIQSCAREFNVQKMWLFGSALEDEETARDYDLAVEGLPQGAYWDLFSWLFDGLPKPVDLVDLSEDLPINVIILNRGQVIYER